jgi:hypothetical protein
MKHLTLILVASLICSCSIRPTKKCKVRKEKCVIKSAKFEYRYGGLTTEGSYRYVTENGYVISSEKEAHVGDTIMVEVVDCRKQKLK